MKIKIKDCGGNYRETITTHRTDDVNLAIDRAIAKRYGKGLRLWVDKGLTTPTTTYGQMINQYGICQTGRIFIEQVGAN